MRILELNQLCKRYRKRVGIENLDLEIQEGELFGFLGPNGSGKTTTIRLLLGLMKPTSGTVRILGADCWRNSTHIKSEIGYLPGDLRLYPWMTGRNAARLLGKMRNRDLTKAYELFSEKFDLNLDVPVRSMSRGMRQKLGLMIAMAHNPRLLILDEPTMALDPLMQKTLSDHLRSLASEGHTVFFSSHSLPEVEDLCDSVAILKEGRLVARDTIQNLRARADRHVRIVWKSRDYAECISPPTFFRVNHRDDRSWEIFLQGETMELVRWCAGQPIEELTIGPPDLSRIFREFYMERNVPV